MIENGDNFQTKQIRTEKEAGRDTCVSRDSFKCTVRSGRSLAQCNNSRRRPRFDVPQRDDTSESALGKENHDADVGLQSGLQGNPAFCYFLLLFSNSFSSLSLTQSLLQWFSCKTITVSNRKCFKQKINFLKHKK